MPAIWVVLLWGQLPSCSCDVADCDGRNQHQQQFSLRLAAPDSVTVLAWVSGADSGSPKASWTGHNWGHILEAVRSSLLCTICSHIGCYNCKGGRHCRLQGSLSCLAVEVLAAQTVASECAHDVVLGDMTCLAIHGKPLLTDFKRHLSAAI